MDLLILHATVITPDESLRDHAVGSEGGKIVAVGPSSSLQGAGAAETVDAGGAVVAPGFIDLHTHGLHRHLVDSSVQDYAAMCALLPRYGVTSFLPTLGPKPKGEDARYLAALAAAQVAGAQPVGFHLEGPFIALTGAFPPEVLGEADVERVEALIRAGDGVPVIFSVSPDFEGIGDLLPVMRQGGTPVFMTHTAATVAQTQQAIEAGVHHATHFYDVFPAPSETDPGVRPCGAAEAVLADERVTVDFILDGEHVDPVAVRMALRCKGAEGVSIITDANIGAGLPPGRYEGFGGAAVEFAYPGGPARLTSDSYRPGVLAGSGLTLDRGMRNAMKLLGVSAQQAVRMCSTNPAGVIGVAARKGRIAVGYDADLVMLDGEWNVKRTWVKGTLRYAGDATQQEDDEDE